VRRISVVLPVYNERESIAPCLRGLASALSGEDHEILVCHDTDEDTTLPAIAAMLDRPASVRLVKNTLGRGALNAIRSGFAAAEGDVVVTSMADLSDPPELIPRMAEKIRAGADVVSGSRYMRGGSQEGGPWLKRTLSRIAGVSLRWITGIGTHDSTSNFRAYSKSFLDSVAIESRAGFEIALELTVKAHLAGRRVDEVPSSWVERESGKSNFKLWKWLPSYLRWYLRAAIEPVAVWALAAIAISAWLVRPRSPEIPLIVHRSTALVLAAAAVAGIILARRFRGRTRLVDAAHLAIWLHPWQATLLRGPFAVVDVAATALASAILVGKRPATPVRTLGISILCATIWLAHAVPPFQVPVSDLDVSWAAALDRAAIQGLRAGIDSIFTFGPLGALGTRAYTPELFWTKLVFWQGALQLGLTILLVRIGLSIRSVVESGVFFFLLLVSTMPDSFAYTAVLGIVARASSKPARLGVAWAGMPVLAVLTIAKFSVGTAAVVCALAIIAGVARQVSLRNAALLAAMFVAVLGAAWWAAAQRLTDFPVWLERSLELSSGYGEASSTPAPPLTVPLAAVAVTAFTVHLWIRSGTSAATAAGLVVLWLALKGGFVRASDHTPTFFGFTLVSIYLFAPIKESTKRESRFGPVLRAICAGVSLAGLAATDGVLAPLERSGKNVLRTITQFTAPARLAASNEENLAAASEKNALPRTREAVGDRPIDFVSYRQSLLFLNGLTWSPRPVFQSYLTFTPELMELNADRFEGSTASEFVLFRFEVIDSHWPAMEDALALQAIARNYEPVLSERGFLLFRHGSREAPKPPIAVEIDRAIRFGERLDLAPRAEGVRVLSLKIEPTTLGRARRFLLKAPEIDMEIGLESGAVVRHRIVPGMVRAGAILDPLLRNQADWIAWETGGALLHPTWIRVIEPDPSGCYVEEIEARILLADGIAPTPDPGRASELVLPTLRTPPSAVEASAPPRLDAMQDQDVVVMSAPSEVRFDASVGKHVLAARYGILPSDWKPDGATFRALLRGPDGSERVLLETHLAPIGKEADRRLRFLRIPFEALAPSSVLLRAEPGPGAAGSRDTVWSDVEIR
jgi:hypothetical protein